MTRLFPKDVRAKTLRLVTPKPSQLTIQWRVTQANHTAVELVNVNTGRVHVETWKHVKTWLREGLIRDVA